MPRKTVAGVGLKRKRTALQKGDGKESQAAQRRQALPSKLDEEIDENEAFGGNVDDLSLLKDTKAKRALKQTSHASKTSVASSKMKSKKKRNKGGDEDDDDDSDDESDGDGMWLSDLLSAPVENEENAKPQQEDEEDDGKVMSKRKRPKLSGIQLKDENDDDDDDAREHDFLKNVAGTLIEENDGGDDDNNIPANESDQDQQSDEEQMIDAKKKHQKKPSRDDKKKAMEHVGKISLKDLISAEDISSSAGREMLLRKPSATTVLIGEEESISHAPQRRSAQFGDLRRDIEKYIPVLTQIESKKVVFPMDYETTLTKEKKHTSHSEKLLSGFGALNPNSASELEATTATLLESLVPSSSDPSSQNYLAFSDSESDSEKAARNKARTARLREHRKQTSLEEARFKRIKQIKSKVYRKMKGKDSDKQLDGEFMDIPDEESRELAKQQQVNQLIKDRLMQRRKNVRSLVRERLRYGGSHGDEQEPIKELMREESRRRLALEEQRAQFRAQTDAETDAIASQIADAEDPEQANAIIDQLAGQLDEESDVNGPQLYKLKFMQRGAEKKKQQSRELLEEMRDFTFESDRDEESGDDDDDDDGNDDTAEKPTLKSDSQMELTTMETETTTTPSSGATSIPPKSKAKIVASLPLTEETNELMEVTRVEFTRKPLPNITVSAAHLANIQSASKKSSTVKDRSGLKSNRNADLLKQAFELCEPGSNPVAEDTGEVLDGEPADEMERRAATLDAQQKGPHESKDQDSLHRRLPGWDSWSGPADLTGASPEEAAKSTKQAKKQKPQSTTTTTTTTTTKSKAKEEKKQKPRVYVDRGYLKKSKSAQLHEQISRASHGRKHLAPIAPEWTSLLQFQRRVQPHARVRPGMIVAPLNKEVAGF